MENKSSHKKTVLFISMILFFNVSYSQISNKLELLDVFNLEYVSDPQISPDGSKIIYVRNFKDIMNDKNYSNLWIVNFDGNNNLPLTTGNQNDYYPRWSNDGKKLIYKSNKDGSTQIYLKYIEYNDESKLTNLSNDIGSVEWSLNDKYIAFDSFVPKKKDELIDMPEKPKGAKWNNPPIVIDDLQYRADGRGYLKQGKQQLFTLPIEGGTPRQVTFMNKNHRNPVWLNDNSHLVFSANLHGNSDLDPNNSELYSVNLSNGKIDTLTTRIGPDSNPRISPNGKKIAYLGFDDEYLGYQQNDIYVMNLDGSSINNISSKFDRNIQNINWSKDGKGFYFQYDDKGNTKLAFISISGQTNDIINDIGGLSLGRPYSGGTYSVSNNGSYAYTYGTTKHPGDLAVGSNGFSLRVTEVNKDLFDYKNLGNVEEIWYKSSYDGREIQGWLVTPPDFDNKKKYPLILEIHGGPFLNYGSRFSAEIQLYAAAGYAVLYINPRGSTSYGKEFGNLIHHNYPSNDYDDLISGVDYVKERDYIDENNLFVTGGSGGGVLSSWIIGKTHKFNAAVVAKPVINWYSFVLYADNTGFFYKYWFPGLPWDNLEEYMERSPITYAGNVKTPTMLLTGEEDYRTPIVESEQFYTALKLVGVETVLVRIPEASHGIASKPSNLIAKVKAVITWFDRYKK